MTRARPAPLPTRLRLAAGGVLVLALPIAVVGLGQWREAQHAQQVIDSFSDGDRAFLEGRDLRLQRTTTVPGRIDRAWVSTDRHHTQWQHLSLEIVEGQRLSANFVGRGADFEAFWEAVRPGEPAIGQVAEQRVIAVRLAGGATQRTLDHPGWRIDRWKSLSGPLAGLLGLAVGVSALLAGLAAWVQG